MYEKFSPAPPRLLKLPEVMERTGLGRTTLYNLARQGEFPAPIKLSKRSSAWLESAVNSWIDERIAEAKKGGV